MTFFDGELSCVLILHKLSILFVGRLLFLLQFYPSFIIVICLDASIKPEIPLNLSARPIMLNFLQKLRPKMRWLKVRKHMDDVLPKSVLATEPGRCIKNGNMQADQGDIMTKELTSHMRYLSPGAMPLNFIITASAEEFMPFWTSHYRFRMLK